MRIGLITDPIDDDTRDPLARGGIFKYTNRLTNALLEIDRDNEYVLIHHRKNEDPLYNLANELVVPLYSNIPLGHEFRKAIHLPLSVRKEMLDLIHEPRAFIPHLFPRTARKVLTVHDLSTVFYPAAHTRLNMVRMRLSLSLSLSRVDRIIAVSNFTRDELIRFSHVPAKVITVVHEGVDESFKPRDDSDVILSKYGIEGEFILFVGTLEPRKNLERVLKAFYKLRRKGLKHKLVIVGVRGWKSGVFEKAISDLRLSKEIVRLGFVPEGDLPALYTASELFVYPSIYEGFGLPPLEAMACGTPVLTSNLSSLPEVVGDAAITVNPYSINAIANAMYEILTNSGLKRELSEKGIRRARLFSWKEAAKETLRVYEETA